SGPARRGRRAAHRAHRRSNGAALCAPDRGNRRMKESDFDPAHFDPRDPNPWLALKLDFSLPIDESAKAALLRGNASWSRRWMFNIVRIPIFLFFLVVKLLRAISPHWPNGNRALHRLIHWGLRN